jgi:hypothetical protein
MPVSYAEARNIVFLTSAVRGRSLFTEKKEHMSGTIKAIERHMILPVRVGLQNRERKLVAEWQRGAEILGHAQQKLRLAFAPAHSPAFATPCH